MKKLFSLTTFLPKNLKADLRHPKTAFDYYWDCTKTKINRAFYGSYSQHSEDIVVSKLLSGVKNGIYVDVGANDPEYISNTRYFYERGWRGINIEPHPEMFEKIVKNRPEDTNLNIGIATQEGALTFYKLDVPAETAGSTFDKAIAEELKAKGYTISAEITMPVYPLAKILEANLKFPKIDFMSVDTEGFDLEVLKSNDWERFRPSVLVVETTINKEQIVNFILSQGYKIVYKNLANTIFKDDKA